MSSQDSSVVRFTTDSPTPLNQIPIQEGVVGTNNFEQQNSQLFTKEQLACANLLLQHLNALLVSRQHINPPGVDSDWGGGIWACLAFPL